MKTIISKLLPASFLGFLVLPLIAFAQGTGFQADLMLTPPIIGESPSGTLEIAIALGYYISTFGFLIAAVLMAIAISKFGTSAIGSALTYFLIGTGSFFAISVFQTLGADFFGISDESMDVWWHIVFYLALISYYLGLKTLVALGSSEESSSARPMISAQSWGVLSVIILAGVFVLPPYAEPLVNLYSASMISQLGVHHFLAFLLAFVVGWYLFTVKKNLGQIGRAIASPMLIGIWALAGQHFWELLFESWKWVIVSTEAGEGGEKIFLTITAIALIYSAWKLKSFARG